MGAAHRAAAALALASAGLAAGPASAPAPSPRSLEAHVRYLADDRLEGRGTGAPGGELAAKYIAGRFEALGLVPAGDGGTWFQQVPLFGVKTRTDQPLAFRPLTLRPGSPSKLSLAFGADWVGATGSQAARVGFDSDVVFVGYGISAPEVGWDDWKGVDVRGRVVMMLVNDPPATKEEPGLFGGRALTYYGRWSYKYEEAARRGAAAALLVHTDDSAGYPWSVVRTSNGGWRFDHPIGDRTVPTLRLRAWLTHDAATRVTSLGGKSLDALIATAATREFTPVPLGVGARAVIESEVKSIHAPNVSGILRGSDPARAGEHVVVSAHWDHLGIAEPDASGDAIYNGAVDNATGVAGMLGIAESLALRPPARSVLFLATTAEEQGLLGATWFAEKPTVAAASLVANVNLDPMNVEALVDDIVPLGAERSTLASTVASVASERGLAVTPDPRPDQGTYYRSDHFPFARKGIPAVGLKSGVRYRGKPPAWAEERFNSFNTRRYHQPSDEVLDGFDWDALAQHAEVSLALVLAVANGRERPSTLPGDEFAPRSPVGDWFACVGPACTLLDDDGYRFRADGSWNRLDSRMAESGQRESYCEERTGGTWEYDGTWLVLRKAKGREERLAPALSGDWMLFGKERMHRVPLAAIPFTGQCK